MSNPYYGRPWLREAGLIPRGEIPVVRGGEKEIKRALRSGAMEGPEGTLVYPTVLPGSPSRTMRMRGFQREKLRRLRKKYKGRRRV